jgi:hypothetical protein
MSRSLQRTEKSRFELITSHDEDGLHFRTDIVVRFTAEQKEQLRKLFGWGSFVSLLYVLARHYLGV